ncbi:MAG: alpha/beta fold hydrolase [Gammaproteobacteria bacterium]|nr:MAG: alpha/beta fold hydrolase [Gammaproteobacteria bacterium]
METTTGGLKTAYGVHGAGAAGSAMVLVHGVGLRSDVWAPQIAAFSASHRVIAYDTLGHGGSDLPPESASLGVYVAQLEGLLDALRIPRAVVIGHSMGAIIATAFAIANPGRVAALGALCPVYDRSDQSRAAALARAEALAATGPAAGVEATLARWFGDDASPQARDKAAALRSWLADADPTGYARAYRVFVSCDEAIVGRLGTLAMPALFLAAEHDPNSTPAMARRMAAEAPRGQAVVLPNARHMVPFVSPEPVNARLRGFLEEHEA